MCAPAPVTRLNKDIFFAQWLLKCFNIQFYVQRYEICSILKSPHKYMHLWAGLSTVLPQAHQWMAILNSNQNAFFYSNSKQNDSYMPPSHAINITKFRLPTIIYKTVTKSVWSTTYRYRVSQRFMTSFLYAKVLFVPWMFDLLGARYFSYFSRP